MPACYKAYSSVLFLYIFLLNLLTLSQMMIVPFFSGMENAFAYFWITDSCPHTVKAITNKPPFEVLSLAGSIADALQI
jgi:hypothetical protein